MTRADLLAAWAEYDRLDGLWLVAIAAAKQALTGSQVEREATADAEVQAHREATRAWVAARNIGPKPVRREDKVMT